MIAVSPVALEVHDLVAGYGDLTVLRGVSFSVKPGKILTILGPNGAGKSTTVLTISRVTDQQGGEIIINGESQARSRSSRYGATVRSRAQLGLGHVLEGRGLFSDCSVAENLKLGFGKASGPITPALINEWFPKLAQLAQRTAGSLSGGEQQMLSLARAMAAQPNVLMIDEMSLGLAPVIVEELMPVLRSLADEHGVAVILVEQHVQLALLNFSKTLETKTSDGALNATPSDLAIIPRYTA